MTTLPHQRVPRCQLETRDSQQEGLQKQPSLSHPGIQLHTDGYPTVGLHGASQLVDHHGLSFRKQQLPLMLPHLWGSSTWAVKYSS